ITDYGRVVKQDQTCKVNDPVVEDSHDMQHKAETFESPLVRSIREKHPNIEKISDFDWEDENQDSEDVL
ncbi:MAG: hypothetical protein WA667_17420, partial [Candidatus Nitrosopolaris sp.]